jgi:hypothetical protein
MHVRVQADSKRFAGILKMLGSEVGEIGGNGGNFVLSRLDKLPVLGIKL